MKKSLLSIAILAAAFCMTACGNKSGDNAGGADSTEVAPEATAQTEIELKTVYDQKMFSVGVPEGWNTTPNNDPETSDIMFFKGDMEQIMSIPCVIFNVDVPEDGKSLEESFKELEIEGSKPLDDVTIGRQTYKCMEVNEDGQKGLLLGSMDKGKTIGITLVNAELNDPEVQAIIESLKVK